MPKYQRRGKRGKSKGKRSNKQPPSALKLQRRRKDKVQKNARWWSREWKYDQQEFPQIITPCYSTVDSSGNITKKSASFIVDLTIYEECLLECRYLDFDPEDCDIITHNLLGFLELFHVPYTRELMGLKKDDFFCCNCCNAIEYVEFEYNIDMTYELGYLEDMIGDYYQRIGYADEEAKARREECSAKIPDVDVWFGKYYCQAYCEVGKMAFIGIKGNEFVILLADAFSKEGVEDVAYHPYSWKALRKLLSPPCAEERSFVISELRTSMELKAKLLDLDLKKDLIETERKSKHAVSVQNKASSGYPWQQRKLFISLEVPTTCVPVSRVP